MAGGGREPGVQHRGTIAIGLVSSELDAYVQLPTSSSWAAGAGVLLSPMHLMPYVQAGRVDAEGSGFYTTQGFAVLAPRSKEWDIDEEAEVAPRYWAPTLAYRATHGGGAVHLYVSGALGWMDIPASHGGPRREPVRLLMAGLSFEAHIRGSIAPIPPPQPPPPTP